MSPYLDKAGISSDVTGILSDKIAISSDTIGVPSDTTGISLDETAIFSDKTAISSDTTSISSVKTGVPPNTKDSALWTILKLISWTDGYLKSFDIDSPRLTAEILLCHVLDIRRLDLYLQFDRPLNKNELAKYKSLIKRRVKKEPVAYITGIKGFWDSQFSVTPDVLIPRPDTEILVETTLALIEYKRRRESEVEIERKAKEDNAVENKEVKKIRVLELGTGSGAVIISLARANPDILFYATDISPQAIIVARKNSFGVSSSDSVPLAGLTNLFFLTGSWFSPIKHGIKFDFIVSNPPYIPTDDIKSLQQEVRDYEPLLALDGGHEGISCLRDIMESASDYLESDGVLLLEMGFDQKQKVEHEAVIISRYDTPEFLKDYAGHDRVVILRKKIKNIENKNKI
ncbi:MAG: peptide chain release factor N(5)-glutamine methyltransferase [Desulfamplus sp.]|nr:peptide chain release factor N(5)-glutamine methyltransferase [Desulfamplus sp.]